MERLRTLHRNNLLPLGFLPMPDVSGDQDDVPAKPTVQFFCELCPKSEVGLLRMSVQNLGSKNQSLKSKVCPKSESETKV